MRILVCSGTSFLLAVLWFDLMFDTQVLGKSGATLPEETLDSISRYYSRVTTTAKPMNRLVGVAMLGTLVALAVEVLRHQIPSSRAVMSLVLVVLAISIALGRTLRNAVRLGRQEEDLVTQSRLARLVLRDHLILFVALGLVLMLQLLPV
ncbi:ER membrane protein SH3 [Actinobacteria bacterium IMCC26256]|nr:ER membrane protein SH3 [Actinobacteria bacterium IMCC26256]